MAIQAIYGEVRKQLLIMLSYRFANLFDIVGYSIIYIAAMFIVGQGDFETERLEVTLIGYIVTFFILETLNEMGYGIMDEALEGTLEQMYMGVIAPVWLLIGKVLAINIKSLLSSAVMGLVLVLAFQISPSFLNPLGLFVLLITLVGVFGFGFLVAALTIIYKQIGSFVNVLSNLLLFMNGTFLAVEAMPSWMQGIAHVFPTTQGIIVMRRVVLEGAWGDVWLDGSMLWLIVHSGVYLVVGMAIYRVAETRAKNDGSLGHY